MWPIHQAPGARGLARALVRLTFVVGITLAAAVPAQAQQMGSEQRSVAGFDAVVLRASGELRVRQRGVEGLVIEAEKRLLPKITSEVKGGVLYLGFAEGSFQTRYPIRFHVDVKALKRLRSEASGDIVVESLSTPAFALEMAGSGDVRIGSLSTRRLAVRSSGSSSVAISGGEATEQQIEIEGSGDYRAPKLSSDDTRVSISGSGDVVVRAARRLDARISGSGDVGYLGNPQVTRSISGAGSVHPVDPGSGGG